MIITKWTILYASTLATTAPFFIYTGSHQHKVCKLTSSNTGYEETNYKNKNMISILWRSTDSDVDSNNDLNSRQYIHQSYYAAYKEIYTYLYNNVMSIDIPNICSLGFHKHCSGENKEVEREISNHDNNDDDGGDLPDGLSNGIIQTTISLSLRIKTIFPWTKNIPKNLYYEYVCNYVNINESRNNWRQLFYDHLFPLLQQNFNFGIHDDDNPSIEDIVKFVNTVIWNLGGDKIQFKSGQTPLLYDVMSIYSFRYASCTGLSIYLVNALRSVGIPARLMGTPAWNGRVENGNHSWIEFWGSDDEWHIIESLPASGKDPSDDYDLWDPCQYWFCNPEKVKDTFFYAARLEKCDNKENVSFPMAWDVGNQCVPGEDRTSFMRKLCSQC